MSCQSFVTLPSSHSCLLQVNFTLIAGNMQDVFKINTANNTYGEVYLNARLDREAVDRYLLKVREQHNRHCGSVTNSRDFLDNILYRTHAPQFLKAMLYQTYTLLLKCVSRSQQYFSQEINTFIQYGCIKLIKGGSKDIYIVTKSIYFK